MALIAAHYAIGTVATLVVPAHDHIQQVTLHNHEHNSNSQIYVNGPGVAVNNGLHLPDTETIQLNLAAGDSMWAISDTTDNELHVLISRM
jgi:heme/copper-type cytochrome/quinol oxidase subunit 2